MSCGKLLSEPGDAVPPSVHDAGVFDAAISDRDSGAALPKSNADGWIALEGFDPDCSIYVAPSTAARNFPPPVAWKQCRPPFFEADDAGVVDDAGADAGLVCEEMADNWGSGADLDAGESAFGSTVSAFVDRASQRVTLALERAADDHEIAIVADADGPVHQAFVIGAGNTFCSLGYSNSVSGNDVIYRVDSFSADGQTEVSAAAIGGPIDDPVHVLRTESEVPAYLEPVVAGATVFADDEYFSGGHVAAWTTPTTLSTWKIGGWEDQFQGDALFSSNFVNNDEVLLSSKAGTIPFISFGSDLQSTAADFGTDGTDMVWIEAFGQPTYEGPWSTINVMTAHFTTDPDAIMKRRLRSETTQPGDRQFTVGCGYAAHEYNDVNSSGTRIVRISDGRSWRIATFSTAGRAVAITCAEIFINFAGNQNRIARIRLDSLGPGDPPD